MFFETSDSVKLFYQTHGNEKHPAVLLLHGLGADHQMWRPQVIRYPESGLFVVAPDMRGHGASSVPEQFTIEDCARDMRELLDDLGIERASVVGVSMGGLIAQQLACDYPQKVSHLIVTDSFSGVISPLERFNTWLALLLMKLLPHGLQVKLLTLPYDSMGKPEVSDYLKARLEKIDPTLLRQIRAEVNNFNILDRLPEVEAPTLVLVGDRFGKLALDMGRRTTRAIAGAKMHVLPGGADPSNMLVPDEFNREVLNFIQEHHRT